MAHLPEQKRLILLFPNILLHLRFLLVMLPMRKVGHEFSHVDLVDLELPGLMTALTAALALEFSAVRQLRPCANPELGGFSGPRLE